MTHGEYIGNNTYSNTTLGLTLYNGLTPLQPGPSGNFYVWIDGGCGTQCRYVANGTTITASP